MNKKSLHDREEQLKQCCDNITKTLHELKESHETVIKKFVKCRKMLAEMQYVNRVLSEQMQCHCLELVRLRAFKLQAKTTGTETSFDFLDIQ